MSACKSFPSSPSLPLSPSLIILMTINTQSVSVFFRVPVFPVTCLLLHLFLSLLASRRASEGVWREGMEEREGRRVAVVRSHQDDDLAPDSSSSLFMESEAREPASRSCLSLYLSVYLLSSCLALHSRTLASRHINLQSHTHTYRERQASERASKQTHPPSSEADVQISLLTFTQTNSKTVLYLDVVSALVLVPLSSCLSSLLHSLSSAFVPFCLSLPLRQNSAPVVQQQQRRERRSFLSF